MTVLPTVDIPATALRIDALMREKGLTVRELQEIFGFSSPQAIYNWLWGASLPSIDSLVILSALLDTKIDDIIAVKQ